ASPHFDFTLLSQSFPTRRSQRMAFYNFGLYAQDEWHAGPNLTFTFALRAEHQSNPLCERSCFARLNGSFESLNHDPDQPYDRAILVNQNQALAHIDRLLWSPRVSFAWQPFGSRGSVLRGGAGIFYDPVPGALAIFFS